MQDGCNRSFKQDYFIGNEAWLAYSPHLDAAFRIRCVLFVDSSTRHNLQALINKPFNRWSRVTNVIKDHAGKCYHIDTITKAKAFKQTIEKPGTKISNKMDERKIQNIEANRALLSHIICAVIYLTKQGLALRGSNESQDSANRGNFLELLHTLALYSPPLKEHLESHSNVKYTSALSQNELIQVIGPDCVRNTG